MSKLFLASSGLCTDSLFRARALRSSREVRLPPGRERGLMEHGRRGEPSHKRLGHQLPTAPVEDDIRRVRTTTIVVREFHLSKEHWHTPYRLNLVTFCSVY